LYCGADVMILAIHTKSRLVGHWPYWWVTGPTGGSLAHGHDFLNFATWL